VFDNVSWICHVAENIKTRQVSAERLVFTVSSKERG